ALGWRGTAHQACDGIAARAARQHALCTRRTDHRLASRGCRTASYTTGWAGAVRQYGNRRGARHASRGRERLGHRYRTWRRGEGWSRGGGGYPCGIVEGAAKLYRSVPGEFPRTRERKGKCHGRASCQNRLATGCPALLFLRTAYSVSLSRVLGEQVEHL